MSLLTIIFLTLATVILWRIATLQYFVTALGNAIRSRRPYLSQTPVFLTGRKSFNNLRNSYNQLLEDNTALKALQMDQLTQIKITMDNLHEAVLIVNSNNVIVFRNQCFTAFFTDSKGEIGQRLEGTLRSCRFLEFIKEIRLGDKPKTREIEFNIASRSVWFEISGSQIPSTSKTMEGMLLFVLHDITRLKHLEKVRSEFVANVSHELRTPVTIIKGFTETLIEEHASLPEISKTRFLGKINNNVFRLHQLLEDLLVLSQLESHTPSLKLKPANINVLIQEILENFQLRFDSANIEVLLNFDSANLTVPIDSLRLTQALENLIENALRHAHGMDKLKIQSQMSSNSSIKIMIEDNGAGIPEEDLPHLFERFYRVYKDRSLKSGGTGLGLSIVKHIIQLHRGSVSVASRVGEYCRFTITLPIR